VVQRLTVALGIFLCAHPRTLGVLVTHPGALRGSMPDGAILKMRHPDRYGKISNPTSGAW